MKWTVTKYRGRDLIGMESFDYKRQATAIVKQAGRTAKICRVGRSYVITYPGR